MENAILNAGVEALNTMKEHVLELEGYRQRNEELTKEEARLDKVLSSREKEIADEIETTVKKRRSEVTDSYESQLGTLNGRKKKVRAKKEKEKEGKVSERIQQETAELREQNNGLATEIKAAMKTDKVPGYCNTMVFFALFKPKALSEVLLLLLCLLLAFFLLPFGIYVLAFRDSGEFALALIYLIDVIVFGGLYLLVNNLVKEKYLDALKRICGLRAELRTNRKKIRLIQKSIRNDTDESGYGLQQYDSELSEIETEIARVADEEKKALDTFDQGTAKAITEEIRGRYQAELASIRESRDKTAKEQKEAEDKVKEFSLMISTQYETYLGKDMMNTAAIDRLIGYIERGEAANIGEALAKEKNKDKK